VTYATARVLRDRVDPVTTAPEGEPTADRGGPLIEVLEVHVMRGLEALNSMGLGAQHIPDLEVRAIQVRVVLVMLALVGPAIQVPAAMVGTVPASADNLHRRC